jgi:ABC-type glycerol-3-phosphate transport system substrate-binding protein
MILRRTSRVGLMLLLTLTVAAGLVFLARPNLGSSKLVIRFWHGFTSKDGEAMLQLVRAFNAANPEIEVQVQRIPWGTYYNKLFVAGLAGRAPEVFISHTTMLSRLERGRFLQPVDALVARSDAALAEDIDPHMWAAVAVEGRHLGVPLDVHPLGLFYNRTLLKEAGLVDAQGAPRPPTNWVEFIAALKKLNRDVNGDGRNDQWGFMFEGTPFITAYTFMLQACAGGFTAEHRGPEKTPAVDGGIEAGAQAGRRDGVDKFPARAGRFVFGWRVHDWGVGAAKFDRLRGRARAAVRSAGPHLGRFACALSPADRR